MKRLLRKVVQGLTTAVAVVAAAALGLSVLAGELWWFGTEAALRVGLPAFIVGMFFFPLDEKTLHSRSGFALRAMLAAVASAAMHRILFYFARAQSDFPIEPIALDVTMWLALGAVASTTFVAYLAQPPLFRLARGRFPLPPIADFGTTGPARVRATRLRG